jgi:hypothetical protein
MRKWFAAAVVAAFVGLPFVALAPNASADEDPVKIRLQPKPRIEVQLPGVISICIRYAHTCDPDD